MLNRIWSIIVVVVVGVYVINWFSQPTPANAEQLEKRIQQLELQVYHMDTVNRDLHTRLEQVEYRLKM